MTSRHCADSSWCIVMTSHHCNDVKSWRVYSQIRRAPLTCTLRERMMPCCGISTHTSSSWIRSTGIPSFSFLQQQNTSKSQENLFKAQNGLQARSHRTQRHSQMLHAKNGTNYVIREQRKRLHFVHQNGMYFAQD